MPIAFQLSDEDAERVNPLSGVDFRRVEATKLIKPESRSELGQFFTPDVTARLMAAMFAARPAELRILDPGAGVGSLAAALIRQACSWGQKPTKITLDAHEIDPLLIPFLEKTVNECGEMSQAVNISFEAVVHQKNFIEAAVDALAAGELFAGRKPNAVILNPPYKKINIDSGARLQLAKIGIETSNLYSAFLWLSARLLEENGEMVSITPRSFCNGAYFKNFRKSFLEEMAIRELLVFQSRVVAFEEDEVLQENIIMFAEKSANRKPVVVCTSDGPEDETPSVRFVPYDQLVETADKDLFIRVVPDELEHQIGETLNALKHTLPEINLTVSTGRVVDFRANEFLKAMPGVDTVPLIYPMHCGGKSIRWPIEGSKKPNALVRAPKTENLLVPGGVYVLVKRFSSKEEKRRIVATVYDSHRVKAGPVGFENHLNYFHREGKGIPSELAMGLAAFLNSTLVDSFFRQFNGHTQVNATDLRSLRYPSVEVLSALGQRVQNADLNQDQLDDAIAEELNVVSDALQAKKKITEAQDILRQLNVPKAQQNERSALTLLALTGMKPLLSWSDVSAPRLGITEMMDYFRTHFGKDYKPNSRESVRRFTVHQFIQVGLVLQNPDDTSRAINSGLNRYCIEPNVLEVIRKYGSGEWSAAKEAYLATAEKIRALQAKERELTKIPVTLPSGESITLSGGGQNVLMKEIIEKFCQFFTPGGEVVYIGDAGRKIRGEELEHLRKLGVELDEHGKMPDVIVYLQEKNWLVLIEAVTSHGPVDVKRHNELKELFKGSTAGLVFVSAFSSRKAALKFLTEVSWETEVWLAEEPTHLIHFNGGERFLGPY